MRIRHAGERDQVRALGVQPHLFAELVERGGGEAPALLSAAAGHGPFTVVATQTQQHASVGVFYKNGGAGPQDEVVSYPLL